MNKVVHAYAASFVFVHVAGTYSPLCGAYVLVAPELFGKTVQNDMPGHDNVSARIYFEIVKGHAPCGKSVYFLKDHLWVKDNSRTYHA